jgi:hypothetical protein
MPDQQLSRKPETLCRHCSRDVRLSHELPANWSDLPPAKWGMVVGLANSDGRTAGVPNPIMECYRFAAMGRTCGAPGSDEHQDSGTVCVADAGPGVLRSRSGRALA